MDALPNDLVVLPLKNVFTVMSVSYLQPCNQNALPFLIATIFSRVGKVNLLYRERMRPNLSSQGSLDVSHLSCEPCFDL